MHREHSNRFVWRTTRGDVVLLEVDTAAEALVAESTANEIARLKVIDAIEAAATLPFPDGCHAERALFFETVQTADARTRIDASFAARAAATREAR